MQRLACVELPALPLQILTRAHPTWRGRAAVVIEADRATARITHVGEAARAFGILPGHRHAAALSLCAELEAGVISLCDLEASSQTIAARLQRLSPTVEPSADEPGVFWLDASGLTPLYPSLELWARALLLEVAREGLCARVVVGFSRMGSYALVRAGGACKEGAARAGDLEAVEILRSPEEERRLMQPLPLDRLGISPSSREALARLGVKTLGALLALPPGALRTRFGPELHRFHRLASEALRLPVNPLRQAAPFRERLELDHAEVDRDRLLFALKGLLDRLLKQLAGRGEALSRFEVLLVLENGLRTLITVRPAAPTLDGPQVADLLRLRLERSALAPGVIEARAEARGVRLEQKQTLLFASPCATGAAHPPRDLEAAARALSRLQAELGEAEVLFARLKPAHLPEARIGWQPAAGKLPAARVRRGRPRLVRRVFMQAPRFDEGHALLRDPARLRGGPHLISGGWWQRAVERRYHFVEGHDGALLWVFLDEVRGLLRLQGRVD